MRLLRSSIGLRLETWRLMIVLWCVAGMLSGCEDFQKELKKKGAELEAAMKQATTLPKAPGQPPDRSQPSGPGGATSRPGQPGQPGGGFPAGRSQTPSSSSVSTGVFGDGVIGAPKLQTALGLPVVGRPLIGSPNPIGTGLGEKEGLAIQKWFDYLDLGMSQDLFDKYPECFAAVYLSQEELLKYIGISNPKLGF